MLDHLGHEVEVFNIAQEADGIVNRRQTDEDDPSNSIGWRWVSGRRTFQSDRLLGEGQLEL